MAKLFVSEKYIVSIDEFMDNYIGKHYDGKEKLTHHVMSMYLFEKGLPQVSRVNFSNVNKNDILMGKYVLVKDKNNQVLVYWNPAQHDLDRLFNEIKKSSTRNNLEKLRNNILSELGYTHDKNGEVITKEEYKEQQDEDCLEVTNKVNRQKYITKRKYY